MKWTIGMVEHHDPKYTSKVSLFQTGFRSGVAGGELAVVRAPPGVFTREDVLEERLRVTDAHLRALFADAETGRAGWEPWNPHWAWWGWGSWPYRGR